MADSFEILETPELFRCREKGGKLGHACGAGALLLAALFAWTLWFMFGQSGEVQCSHLPDDRVRCEIRQSGPLGVGQRHEVVDDVVGVEQQRRRPSSSSRTDGAETGDRLVLRVRDGRVVPISRFGWLSGREALQSEQRTAIADAIATRSTAPVDVSDGAPLAVPFGLLGGVMLLGALLVLRSLVLTVVRPREIVVDRRTGTLSLRNRIRRRDRVVAPLTSIVGVHALHGHEAGVAAFPELAALASLSPAASGMFGAVAFTTRDGRSLAWGFTRTSAAEAERQARHLVERIRPHLH